MAFEVFLSLPIKQIKGTAFHRSLAWRERTLLETNMFSLEHIMHNFKDLDYVTNLPDVKCPIHFAVGRLDPVAPCQHVETMHKNTPGSTLRIIEWAGHNCMDSQPGEFNRWFRESMRSFHQEPINKENAKS
jgi:pimeloyl-ACP methyl ester carboxylesterase